jgi:uncharacterized membrane protein YesL
MQPASRLIYEWLVEVYYSFTELMIVNVLWFVFTLPMVTAPPAAAGLYFATNQLAHQQPTDWRSFFTGFRRYFWVSWRWCLLNLVVFAGLGGNFWHYGQVQAAWGVWIQGLFVSGMVLWSLLQLYTFPLLIEQQEARLRLALRNSAVLFVRRPGFSLGLSAFAGILAGLSTFVLPPAWLIFTAGLCAYLANKGAIHLIDERSQAGREPV